MKPLEVYKKIESKSLPLMEAYQKDLVCWDKKFIFQHPDTPFIHFTRKTGTHLEFFFSAEKYPPKNQTVKYLFSYADRYHILKQVKEVVEYLINKTELELILYYNTKTVKEIDASKARSLTSNYYHKMKRKFDENSRSHYSKTLQARRI